MTEVRIDVRRPDAVTPEVGVAGRMLRWTPWDRRVEPTWVTPPAPVVVPLVDGVATAVLVPGYWRVDELTPGGVSRVVQVPDVELVEYAALPSLDPVSLDPSAEPDPAWWAALEQGAYGVAATVDPTDPRVLMLRFPAWRQWPGDTQSIAIPVLGGTQ